jgi:hypothetical protein
MSRKTPRPADIDNVLGYMFTYRINEIRSLLSRNGVNTAGMGTAEVQLAFLKAVQDSPSFRLDAGKAIASVLKNSSSKISSMKPNYLNVVTTADELATQQGDSVASTTAAAPVKTSIWDSLKGAANTTNISNLFNTGLETLSTKLKNNANSASEERALEIERIRLAQIQAQNEAPKAAMPTWAIVAVVGVVVVGGFLIIKKSKK